MKQGQLYSFKTFEVFAAGRSSLQSLHSEGEAGMPDLGIVKN